MSYLATTLDRLMRLRGFKNIDVSRGASIDQATLSRILNGQQQSISDEDLARLCEFISSKKSEQAELIAARMRDVQVGPGADLIELTIQEQPLALRDTPGPLRLLPPRIEEAIDNIRRHILTDVDLRDIILALRRIYSQEPPESKKSQLKSR